MKNKLINNLKLYLIHNITQIMKVIQIMINQIMNNQIMNNQIMNIQIMNIQMMNIQIIINNI